MKKTSRHDKLIIDLEQRLNSNGWKTTTFKEYHHENGDGEIDLYGTKDGYRILVEAKSSMTLKNYYYAHKQMSRARKNYFNDDKRTFCFFASYDNRKSNAYTLEWVDPDNQRITL